MARTKSTPLRTRCGHLVREGDIVVATGGGESSASTPVYWKICKVNGDLVAHPFVPYPHPFESKHTLYSEGVQHASAKSLTLDETRIASAVQENVRAYTQLALVKRGPEVGSP